MMQHTCTHTQTYIRTCKRIHTNTHTYTATHQHEYTQNTTIDFEPHSTTTHWHACSFCPQVHIEAEVLPPMIQGEGAAHKGEGRGAFVKVSLKLCWFTCSLVHWFTGSLVHWFTGSLVHWLFAGCSLVQTSRERVGTVLFPDYQWSPTAEFFFSFSLSWDLFPLMGGTCSCLGMIAL